MKQEQLIKECRALIALIDNPEPGIGSWHVACQEVAERIHEASAPDEANILRVRFADGTIEVAGGEGQPVMQPSRSAITVRGRGSRLVVEPALANVIVVRCGGAL